MPRYYTNSLSMMKKAFNVGFLPHFVNGWKTANAEDVIRSITMYKYTSD